jgi:chitin disaccharide deacetylase
MSQREPVLIVTADDYGYAGGYNRGILEAAEARALDAVSAMVGRSRCEAEPLVETGVEIGLHLELPGDPPAAQLERFEALFGRPPAYIDGHKHCHAGPAAAQEVIAIAARLEIPVRSIDPAHRERLRRAGVATPDRLIGRLDPAEPALPAELAQGRQLPRGVTEWMVHPGHPDPEAGSSYDGARREDLDLVLRVGPLLARAGRRATHRAALGVG